MSAADEPDAKRQKVSGHSYSVETDVEVEVEGEVIGVHSLLLMMLSPVFHQMLKHNMKESSSSRIKLPGKKKSEFRLFWEMIQPLSAKELDYESAKILAKWSDEYQVQALKDKCDMHLSSCHAGVPAKLASLIMLAYEFNLPKLQAQCIVRAREMIERESSTFLEEWRSMGARVPEDAIKQLWPTIRKKSVVPEAMGEMPDIHHIRAVWPFIMSAMATDKIKQQWRLNEAAAFLDVMTPTPAPQRHR